MRVFQVLTVPQPLFQRLFRVQMVFETKALLQRQRTKRAMVKKEKLFLPSSMKPVTGLGAAGRELPRVPRAARLERGRHEGHGERSRSYSVVTISVSRYRNHANHANFGC